jgi:hypothetical protein
VGYYKYITTYDYPPTKFASSTMFLRDDAYWQKNDLKVTNWIADEDYYTKITPWGYHPGTYNDPWWDEYSKHSIGWLDGVEQFVVNADTYFYYDPGFFSQVFYAASKGNVGPSEDTDRPEAHISKWTLDGVSICATRIKDMHFWNHGFYDYLYPLYLNEVANGSVLLTIAYGSTINQAVVATAGGTVEESTMTWTELKSMVYKDERDYPYIRSYPQYHNSYEWDADSKGYYCSGVNGSIAESGACKTLDLRYTYSSPLNGNGVLSGSSLAPSDNGILYYSSTLPHIYGYIHDTSSGPNPEFDNVTTSQTTILSLDGSVTLGIIEVPMEVIIPTTYDGELWSTRVFNNQLYAIGFTEDGIPHIASAYGDIYIWNGTSYTHSVDSRKWDWSRCEFMSAINSFDWGSYVGYGDATVYRFFYHQNGFYMATENISDDDYYEKTRLWKFTSLIGSASCRSLFNEQTTYRGQYTSG